MEHDMSSQPNAGLLHQLYRQRIGTPTTADEVRGYWVFVVGLLLAVLGVVLFLPSESATGTSGFTLRELSIFLAAVGLAMLFAGPVIRLPVQSWANYAAYGGQAICFLAAVWFLLVFPQGWSVATGNQPVIVLYAVGLLIIAIGGIFGPLLVGDSPNERRAQAEAEELTQHVDELHAERQQLHADLETATDNVAAETDQRAQLQATVDAMQTSQARFELYQDRGDEWRWRLRHRNGNVIADSGEGYTRKHNAKKGLQSVRRNALGAELRLIDTVDELPSETESITLPAERESQATFEVYEDQAGEFRFRLRHDNGNILADSGEGYQSSSNVRRALDRLQDYIGPAQYLWADPTAFEVYRDRSGNWRWRLVHRNGNILADSGQGYTRRHDTRRAIDRLQESAALDFEVYEDQAGEYRWRIRGTNQQIMADSGEGYSSEDGAKTARSNVREYIPAANVLDIGQATFEIYEDQGGEYRWRLRHRNGNILLDSGQGYASRSGARDGIERVKRHGPSAPTTTS